MKPLKIPVRESEFLVSAFLIKPAMIIFLPTFIDTVIIEPRFQDLRQCLLISKDVR